MKTFYAVIIPCIIGACAASPNVSLKAYIPQSPQSDVPLPSPPRREAHRPTPQNPQENRYVEDIEELQFQVDKLRKHLDLLTKAPPKGAP